MNLSELAMVSRDNVSDTYLRLGQSGSDSTIEHGPGFDSCRAKIDLAFCNFALRLRLDEHPDGSSGAIRDLKAIACAHPAFRVFALTGDSPSSATAQLVSAGFRAQHRLVQMASTAVGIETDLELVPCESSTDRIAITEFMASQFFSRQSQILRNHIIRATAESSLSLYSVVAHRKIAAGVMLNGMEHAIGLYNLCVEPSLRRRGLGSAVLRSVASMASAQRLPVVLQCDPSVEAWYRARSYATIGSVEAFSINSSHF